MSDTKCTICRLCLHVVSDNSVKPLEEIANIVQSILPRSNLNITSNPMICNACNELVEKSYGYKLFCLGTDNKLYTEENIHSGVLTKMKKETGNESNNCCRFCSQPVDKNNFRKLNNLDAGMMEVCIPKLDPPLMQNDILCETCLDNIQVHYNFVEMCLKVEERINIYCKAYGNETNGEVDLLHILEFSHTDNYIGKLEIKEEKLEENDLPAGDILMEMDENWLTKEEIPFKDEPEVYDTRLEALKVESQEAPKQAVDEITLECTERTYLTNNKQFARNVGLHKDTSDLHMFKCRLCTYQCKLRYHLIRHVLVHRNPAELEMFKCHLCTYQSKLKYHLTRHMLVHKDPAELDMFKCNQCKYQAKRKRDLKRHIVSLHRDSFILTKENEEITWECTKCTYLTTDKYLFEKHLMVHRDSKELRMFKCHLCNYQSKFKGHLKRHMLVHRNPTELDMYNCSQCEYQARRKRNLYEHVALVHQDCFFLTRGKEKARLECIKCTYITTEKYLLEKHLMVHADPSKLQMFKCHNCTYQSKKKYYLKRHMLVHRDPKELDMYSCSQCEYQTKRKKDLKTHTLSVHKDSLILNRESTENILECPNCTYLTTDKFLFKKHLMTHKDSNELQMFECHNCSHQTKLKSNLIKHMLVHRNPKELVMFKCSQCKYQGKRKKELEIHMLVHKDPSEVTMYKCNECCYETKHKSCLRKHVLVH